MTVRDICLDPDLFRAAFPHWPHPEPDEPVFAPVPEQEDWRNDRADPVDPYADEPGED
jgi:hypothetical protein